MSMNNIHPNLDDLLNQLTSVDFTHDNADMALSTVMLSWLNNNYTSLTADSTALVLDICSSVLGNHNLFGKALDSLNAMSVDPEQMEYNPGLAALVTPVPDLNTATGIPSNDTIRIFTDVESEDTQPQAPGTIRIFTDLESDDTPQAPGTIQVLTIPDTEEQAPVVNESIVDSIIEDLTLANGIAIVSGEDWRKSKFARTVPVLVKNFDFRHLELPELGRASYMLIAPNKAQDVRIELRSQSVPGSAGNKLPVVVRKLRRLQQEKEYGQTFIGIVGKIDFFQEDALSLTREETLKSGNILYYEGDTPVMVALSLVLNNVSMMYAPKVTTPSAEQDLDMGSLS